MSGKQIGGILCIVLAAVMAVGAVLSLAAGSGPPLHDPSMVGISYAIGSFLPSLVALIIGLVLLKKPPTRGPVGRETPRARRVD